MDVSKGRHRVTAHARARMELRGLTEAMVRSVIAWPDAHEVSRPGRVVFQARRRFPPDGKVYLVRVIVDMDRHPPEIVSAYRTTHFSRYEA